MQLANSNQFSPLPIELISGLPEHLQGFDGSNRARGVPCQITADHDLAAIWMWLNEFIDSPSTFRAYRKEAERFYNWVLWACDKPLSSVTREDLLRYDQFMIAPEPHAIWCGKRTAKRGKEAWRPFEDGLQAKSRMYAMTVIGALFTYLVDVRYLSGNPYSARRRKGRAIKAQNDPKKHDTIQKYIPLALLRRLLNVLLAHAVNAPDGVEKSKAERMLFVVRFLAYTGLRREEMCTVVMSDIYSRQAEDGRSRWYMRVLGKGGVVRDIALVEPAREALRRYRQFYQLPELKVDNTHLFLPLSGVAETGTAPLNGQMIYNVVIEALTLASKSLLDEDAVRILAAATPHWLRHTFATVCLERGMELKYVQIQLGHASIETTASYQHAGLNELYDVFSELSF